MEKILRNEELLEREEIVSEIKQVEDNSCKIKITGNNLSRG